MAKTKNKSHSEVEHLRGENKKLKSENRQLKRRLSQLVKEAHFYENIVEEETEDIKIKRNTCKLCGKGILEELDLTHIVVVRCDTCDFRESKKPRKK